MTNQEIVTQAISYANAENEAKAQQQARDCIKRIVTQQNVIKNANLEIGKIKLELAAIVIEPVDASMLT